MFEPVAQNCTAFLKVTSVYIYSINSNLHLLPVQLILHCFDIIYVDDPLCRLQTKQKWTAALALRTRSSTTCWSSCSLVTGRWRNGSLAPSASTTTSSLSSSADTPPASTAALRSRPARSAGRPSVSGSSYSSELLRPLGC